VAAWSAAFTVAAVAFALVLFAGWSARTMDPTRAPWSSAVPVLGGSVPPTHAWSRFHLRYYPMTLLFIAFEMEMMFMYPWAVVYVQEGTKALVEMGMFLGILSLGIVYAWREGALAWQ
jgi:NADH-quinone oxidoreductase subunit A